MRSVLATVVIAAGVWASASVAWADSTGTDTGTQTSGADGSGDDACGSCEDPGDSVAFTDPLDGAQVPAELTVMVDVNYSCSCDDCGCYQDLPSEVTIAVDEGGVYSCFDGCTGPHQANVTLTPGTHEITATAQYSFHTESATVTVTVVEGATGGNATGGSGATDASAT